MRRALNVTRSDNFAEWYQAVVRDADMAEASPVRGCMVIKPWGYGVWELIQAELDRRIKATGHENCYFPLFVPLSFFAKEAEHVEGFAKEMAVVTHHRLKMVDGQLVPDPAAKLEEPLIVRPTSETIIGDAFSRWVKSYRDLPLLINQWANVVRWEMRTRLFLRTTEFLWQEGHTAHVDEEDARAETLRMLDVYARFAEDILAIPVVTGEKPENERFPGAVATYSIEAMMQDGKALQAGTSHFLGTHFAEAQNIRYQSEAGELVLCNTTSWGVSTRLIGGVIMTHGDDDGLRLPPAIAPQQVVIVPMLRGGDQDARLLDYCDGIAADLRKHSLFGVPLRVLVDRKQIKSTEKRWNWVRRGAPVIVEVGPRDMDNDAVSYFVRTALYAGEKLNTQTDARQSFVAAALGLLEGVQTSLFEEAKTRLHGNIATGFADFAAVADHFAGGATDDDENDSVFKGWVKVGWSRPTGAALDAVEQRLKASRLTIRNAPLDQNEAPGMCIFSGDAAVETILIGRSY